MWLGCLLEPGLHHRPSVLTCLPSPEPRTELLVLLSLQSLVRKKNDRLCSWGQGDNVFRTTVLLRSLCVSVLLINKHLPHSLEEDAQVAPSKWQSMALTGWSVSCEGANQPPRICCSHKKQEQPSYEDLSCVNQSDNGWVYGWS